METCIKCSTPVSFSSGKKCKLCQEPCCFEHLQYDKHDCIKTRYEKFIRKDWLRKKGQNISGGKYIVVCDECGYRSNRETSPIGTIVENEQGTFIEVAGVELEQHSQLQGCSMDKIFLEQTNEDDMDRVRGMRSVDETRRAKEYRR